MCTSVIDFLGRIGSNRGAEECGGDDDKDEFQNPSDCFKGGTVKSRVTRYDEDRDLSLNALKFANDVPLWRFVFHHPDRGPAPISFIQDMELACDPDLDGAFILGSQTPANRDCWNAAHRILEKGVMNQSCAEYFPHMISNDANKNGFNIKFVRCEDFD